MGLSLLVPPRRPSRELLDDPSLCSEEMTGSLADIAALDRIWAGSRILGRWLLARRAFRTARRARILDVGAGSGAPSRRLRRVLADGGSDAEVFALDLQWRHLASGAAADGARPLPAVAGDALRLPLADLSVDWAVSTLFLHHLSEQELASLLAELGRVARRGVALLDLRRHVFPLAFVSVAGPLLCRTRTSRLDGLASIRQAYTRRELATIARRAWRAAEVRRVFPYRLLVTAERV
ncbi:MAG TPA: methyltransferase domain-containing protein [Thermoanaerobaculia bacterium]